MLAETIIIVDIMLAEMVLCKISGLVIVNILEQDVDRNHKVI